MNARLIIIAITMLGGGVGAYVWLQHWGFAAIGMLVGLVIGLQIVRIGSHKKAKDADFGLPQFCSNPVWAVGLGVVAWGAVALLWLWSLATGWLSGEGAGLVLLFIVLPLTTFFWLIGGPMTSQAARLASRQIELGQRPETGRSLIRTALTLSRMMTIAYLGFLVWLALAVFV